MSKVHFIGVGGIGVSALARYYIKEGWKASGSDLAESEITKDLEKIGLKFFKGEKTLLDKNKPDLLIYSPAVKEENLELIEAKRLGIKCLSYPEALGELTKEYFTIAVCGTHGKSTTTAMVSLILVSGGFDPTVVVGTKIKEFGDSNFRRGKSQYLVVEACEHMESFLNYWPKVIVLTNIEADHLDYYKNMENIKKAFKRFIGHLPSEGLLIYCSDDKNARLAAKEFKRKNFQTFGYSLKQVEAKKIAEILKIPGNHNISNALAALEVGRSLAIPDKINFRALSEFRGAWRRFEENIIKIGKKKMILVSDYGHHPTEIRVTLEAAREKWPNKFIRAVFQPHQHLRTHQLFKDFVKVLRKAPIDEIIITDIYDVAGREEKNITKKVNAEKIVRVAAKRSVLYKPKNLLFKTIINKATSGEVLIIMGAGDIYDLSKLLLDKYSLNQK